MLINAAAQCGEKTAAGTRVHYQTEEALAPMCVFRCKLRLTQAQVPFELYVYPPLSDLALMNIAARREPTRACRKKKTSDRLISFKCLKLGSLSSWCCSFLVCGPLRAKSWEIRLENPQAAFLRALFVIFNLEEGGLGNEPVCFPRDNALFLPCWAA